MFFLYSVQSTEISSRFTVLIFSRSDERIKKHPFFVCSRRPISVVGCSWRWSWHSLKVDSVEMIWKHEPFSNELETIPFCEIKSLCLDNSRIVVVFSKTNVKRNWHSDKLENELKTIPFVLVHNPKPEI